jgi:hypothetical protein
MKILTTCLVAFILISGILLVVNTDFSRSNIDASKTAKTWDVACDKGDSQTVGILLKAIEIKQEKAYIPALEAFVYNRRPTSVNRALAVHTLDKLGAAKIADHYNAILADEILAESTIFSTQIREKKEALKFMIDGGYEIHPLAKEAVLSDINKMTMKGYPNHALSLLAQARKMGITMNPEDQKLLEAAVTKNPRNVEADDLAQSGIKPDWTEMILHHEKFDIDLGGKILAAADNDGLNALIKNQNNVSHNWYKFEQHARIAKVILGDKEETQEIINSGKFLKGYSEIWGYAESRLPDEFLLAALKYDGWHPFFRGSSIFEELKDRGFENEIKTYVEKKQDEFNNALKDSKLSRQELTGEATWSIDYDSYMYMEALNRIREKYPQSHSAAFNLVSWPMFMSWDRSNDRAVEWIKDNPEKYASALKTALEVPMDPKEEEIPGDDPQTLKLNQYMHRDVAFGSMIYLPEPVFKKNFKDVDENLLTKSAYITADYFNTKWADKMDQLAFYEKYKRQ